MNLIGMHVKMVVAQFRQLGEHRVDLGLLSEKGVLGGLSGHLQSSVLMAAIVD
jgi:hypothetical protein